MPMPKPLPLTFKELRFRVETLHAKGYQWDRIARCYVKRIRYDAYRHQRALSYSEIKAHYIDHEDFLDFIEYQDKRMIRELATYIAEHSYFQVEE